MIKKVKEFIKENGFTSLGMLIAVGVGLWYGMKIVWMPSLGFIIGRNWEIIRNLWNEKYKEKAEDFIDDVRDRING